MLRHVLALALSIVTLPALAAGFRAFGLPGSQLAALSADGQRAAGGLIGHTSGGFAWADGRGAEPLPGAMSVRAMSPNGRYVVGTTLDADGREVATWWSADGRAHPIGGFADADARAGVLSAAWGVADDLTIVGNAVDGRHASIAFAWSPSLGLRALEAGTGPGAAVGISRDGRRVYGWIEDAQGRHACVIWNDLRLATRLEPTVAKEPVGADRDANTVLVIAQGERGDSTPLAWFSSQPATPVSFGTSASTAPLRLVAASDDAQTLVGTLGSGAQRDAVVWTADGGIQSLTAFAHAHGIVVPPGWTLVAATAISADGRRIGGYGLRDGRFDSFVIDLPPRAVSAPATSRTAS